MKEETDKLDDKLSNYEAKNPVSQGNTLPPFLVLVSLTLVFSIFIIGSITYILKEEQARIDSQAAVEAAKADSLRRCEAARRESLKVEYEKSRINELKNAIRIINVYPSKPNSAGGVDVHTIYRNTSSKTYKYVSFKWVPINAVGDVVACSIWGFRIAGGKVTGPVKPGETRGYGRYWDCVWYNNTVTKVLLTGIEIEYMDGTNITIGPKDIGYVYKKQELP